MMQMNKQPKKFTLIHQKDQHDLFITDWNNYNQFASLVRSLFNLSQNTTFYLMDVVTNNIFDLAAFFSQDFYPQNTYQVIAPTSAGAQTPNKSRSNNTNGSQYGSSGAADFGGRESSLYFMPGSGMINASRVNIGSNQFNATNPRASRSASYDLNQQFKYTNNNSAINSNTNNNTIMHFDDTPTNMSRVIHDFEAFMHDNVPSNYYCVLFFDDQDQLKVGSQLAKQINQPFPNFDVYYSLYPSKRSRGAFVPSDSPYLLQLYHGKEMIFERELSINEPINSEIIDAIGNYIKNTPKSSSIATQQDHLFTQEQHSQPINFFNVPSKNQIYVNSQANQILPYEFKSDESPNLMSQDITFELVEILCQSRFRDIFDDDEFKYILKQVRKKNPDITSAYQNFKIFNDESEFEQSLKQIAAQYDKKMTPTKIDVSFENKEKRSSLKKLKKGQRQNGQSRKWDLKSYKGMRKFLRDYNKNNILSIEEASIIVYCSHPSNQNNREFLNMIDSLENFNNPDILQGYGRQISQRIVVKYFEKKEAEQINIQKEDILSPICGAFMHLRAMGNIDEFLDILSKNLQCFDQKDTSFSNNNPVVNCNNIVTSINPLNIQLGSNSVPNIKDKSNIPSIHGSTREIFSTQQQPVIYQPRMSRTDIQSIQMAAIPESSEINDRPNFQREDFSESQQINQIDGHTQSALFAYSQIAKKKSGERRPTFSLGLNGNNMTRQRADSRRGSTRVLINNNQDQQVIEIIDKFHQAIDQVEFDEQFFEALRKLRIQMNLSQQQEVICEKMYYNRYVELIDILDKINKDANYLKQENNKTEILNLIESKADELNDEEEESPLSKSPKVKNRRDKYLKFKNLLNFLFENKGLISLKEFNTFNFLYTKEDINVLSAFEVYLHNQDLADFTQSLKLIDQLYFFKNYLDYDEIESFDESTNKQLSILFYLRKYISYDQAQVYEKLIRLGDSMLFDLYKRFKQKRDKEEFIEKVKNYANQRKLELSEAEQKVKQQKQCINMDQINMKELIDTFQERLMSDVHHVELVHELIDNDDPIAKAIYEVYNYTKDKQELTQNVTLLYKHQFFVKLEQKTLAVLKDLNLLRNQEIKIKEKIRNRDITLVSAYNQYLEEKNEEEFAESVSYLQY